MDICDQRIAYYAPNLRCRRTWIPLFLQCINIVRNNSFIVHRELHSDKKLSHKDFTMGLVNVLVERAKIGMASCTRNLRLIDQEKHQNDEVGEDEFKNHSRMSRISPKLPEIRKDRPSTVHVQVLRRKQHACVYCCFTSAKAKIQGEPPVKIRNVLRACNHCKVHLCLPHFKRFHEE